MKKLPLISIIIILPVVLWYGYGWYSAQQAAQSFTLTTPPIEREALLEVSVAPIELQHRLVGERVQSLLEADVAIIFAEAEALAQESPETALLPYRYDVVIEEYSVGPYYSALLERQEYTGGAHTNYRHEDYVYKNHNALTLSEFLEEEGIAEYDVYNFLRASLARDELQPIDEGLHEIRHWVVVPDEQERPTVRVIFPPYQVGPFSAGTITYTFPLSQ